MLDLFRGAGGRWWEEGALFALGQTRCAGAVSSRNGVKPNKEGAAEEQTIAWGRAFTGTKGALGLNPQPELLLHARNLLDRAGLYPGFLKVSLFP